MGRAGNLSVRVGDAVASGAVEVILQGWKQTEGSVHLVTPPGGPRPARVEALADFLARHFAKKAARKVNREGQRWTDDRPGMTLRLPIDLREVVTEEFRVKGDLARIVLYALSREARLKLKEWAEAERVSVNAIIVSVLEEFFKQLKKSQALREEQRLEIRTNRGLISN